MSNRSSGALMFILGYRGFDVVWYFNMAMLGAFALFFYFIADIEGRNRGVWVGMSAGLYFICFLISGFIAAFMFQWFLVVLMLGLKVLPQHNQRSRKR